MDVRQKKKDSNHYHQQWNNKMQDSSPYTIKQAQERLISYLREVFIIRVGQQQGGAEGNRRVFGPGLDEDRLSDRKLFPPDLKGVSW